MKQREHVRRIRTKRGLKSFVVNRGNRRSRTKRCSDGDDVKWDLNKVNSPENVKRWKKFYADKAKVPSVKDIMGEDFGEEDSSEEE